MVRYIEILDNFLEQNKFHARCPEINSFLDMLFCCHLQQKSVDTAAISAYFGELDDILKELPVQKASQVVALAGKFQKSCHPERAKRVEGSSHLELVQYANRCEDPSTASPPYGSDFAQDGKGFWKIAGAVRDTVGADSISARRLCRTGIGAEAVQKTKAPVILSERSESKDLRTLNWHSTQTGAKILRLHLRLRLRFRSG